MSLPDATAELASLVARAAHDRGGIWINSINDLGKRSSIVSFGYTRRNIRRVTEAIAAQEKDTHSFTDVSPIP